MYINGTEGNSSTTIVWEKDPA
jgi:hypothetical protein